MDITPRRPTTARNYRNRRATGHLGVRTAFQIAKSVGKIFSSGQTPKRTATSGSMFSQRAPLATNHTSSAGAFTRGRRIPQTKTSSFSKTGFVQDWTVGGRVQDPDCVYIGHTDLPSDTTFYNVCISLVRSLLRMVQLDIETQESVIPFITAGRYIVLQWIDSTNVVQQATFDTQTAAGTTVRDVGEQIYIHLRNQIFNDSKRTYTRIMLTETADNTGATRITLNLNSAIVSFCNTSYLKVQNSTQSSTAGAGNNDSDDINAVPLEGFSYFGKGNFTGLKPYAILTKGSVATSDIPAEITSDSDRGLMVFRQPNAPPTNHYVTTQPYKNPPPADQMKNCNRSAYANLEPGNIKTDKLESSGRMPFNRFLQSIYISGWANAANPAQFGQFNRSRLGHFKLFALEKKLYSNNQDQCQVRYEIQQFIRTSVYLKKVTDALVYNRPKELVDYIPQTG